MTMELTELSPPTTWAIRGIDGPVRGRVKGTIEARAEVPRNLQKLKERLESAR